MIMRSILSSLIFGQSFCCIMPMGFAQDVVTNIEASKATVIDSRIKVIDYNRNAIVQVTGHTGFQITVEFEANEEIETVGIGNSNGWQITPNSVGSVLFLKPTKVASPTNLSIITNKRSYNIELLSRSGENVHRSKILYVLRFRVPAPKAVKADIKPPPLSSVMPENWNRNYSYGGSDELVPLEVFDDGVSTYFRMAEGSETPAIFATSKKEGDNLVNIAVRGPYIVVDRIGTEFVMKLGGATTHIYNEAIPAKVASEGPRRREEKRKRFLGIF